MEIFDGNFFFWSIFGAITMLFSIGRWVRYSTFDASKAWRSAGPEMAKSVLDKAKKALRPYRWTQVVGLFWPSMIVAGGILMLHSVFSEHLTWWDGCINILATFTGCTVFFTLGYWMELRWILKRNWAENANMAAKMLGRMVDPTLATPVLIKAAKHKLRELRFAAVSGLKELSNQEAEDALQKLNLDSEPIIAEAAKNALIAVERVSLPSVQLSIRNLEKLITQYLDLHSKLRMDATESWDADERKHKETYDLIDEIVFSQLILRKAFPHAYCRKCYAWAEQIHSLEWSWVQCRQCKKVEDLVPNVNKVTAQVGESFKWKLNEGQLRISLWDNKTQKARNAEIEALEIIGGKEMDYDWAVSAVLEKLHNENPAYGKSISVRLINHPTLSLNTLQLIREMDPKFENG